MGNALRAKYGGKTPEAARRAARAEVPGSDLLLQTIERMSLEVARPRIPPDRLADVRWVYARLLEARDGLLERIKVRYGLYDGGTPAAAAEPKPAPPETKPQEKKHALPATGAVSDSTRIPADIVARLGKEPTAEIAADHPDWTPRRLDAARERLGIPAFRRKVAWTEKRLTILDEEPDNAKAAEKLGITVAAVKTARSRRRSK